MLSVAHGLRSFQLNFFKIQNDLAAVAFADGFEAFFEVLVGIAVISSN